LFLNEHVNTQIVGNELDLNWKDFSFSLTKIQIYPFWYPFYPFPGWGKKLLHYGHITHKYRPNSKKSYGKLKF